MVVSDEKVSILLKQCLNQLSNCDALNIKKGIIKYNLGKNEKCE